MAAKRFEATVRGRVQGVFFRHHAAELARRLGLSGRVANQPDGSVRVIAEGDEGNLSSFAAWLHRGPPAARVDSVEIAWSEPIGESGRFCVET